MGRRMYTPADVKLYRERVHWLAFAAMRTARLEPFEYAKASITVWNCRLDADNSVADLLDAMNGACYPNDGRILDLHIFKRKDKKGPRATVQVEEYEAQ